MQTALEIGMQGLRVRMSVLHELRHTFAMESTAKVWETAGQDHIAKLFVEIRDLAIVEELSIHQLTRQHESLVFVVRGEAAQRKEARRLVRRFAKLIEILIGVKVIDLC